MRERGPWPASIYCSIPSPRSNAFIRSRTTLDELDTEPTTVAELLDSIPGAFESAQEGLAEIRSGKGIPLEES